MQDKIWDKIGAKISQVSETKSDRKVFFYKFFELFINELWALISKLMDVSFVSFSRLATSFLDKFETLLIFRCNDQLQLTYMYLNCSLSLSLFLENLNNLWNYQDTYFSRQILLVSQIKTNSNQIDKKRFKKL